MNVKNILWFLTLSVTITEDAITHKWYASHQRQNIETIHEFVAGSGRSHKQELPSVAMNVLRLNVCQHKIQILNPNNIFPKQGKKRKKKNNKFFH